MSVISPPKNGGIFWVPGPKNTHIDGGSLMSSDIFLGKKPP